jgi:hypothetical protein
MEMTLMGNMRNAQKVIDVMRQTVSQSVGNGANVIYSSGVVESSSGYYCSAFVGASDYASEYIRLLSGQIVSAGSYVLVGQLGIDSWVEQILPQSMFSRMVVNHEDGRIGVNGSGAAGDWDFGTAGEALISGGAGPATWEPVAPAGADFLVGTAQAGLSGEIVVGTTPGGELGGTWASPTVDTVHAGGTSHAGIISTHEAASDPHTGYQKESEKGATGGYASLDGSTLVPKNQLGTGSPGTTTYLRGDGQWMTISTAAPTFSGARVHRTANQSISADTDTIVTFPTGSATEDFDTDSYHSMSTNTGRLTIPASGYYYVTCAAEFGSGTGYRQVGVLIDGTTIIASERVERASGGNSTSVEASTPYSFTAGQYIEMEVRHDHTSSLNINAGDNTFISVFALQGAEGPQGPQGDPGADGFYHHSQLSADTTWTINHNLGRNPVVSVLDSAGSQIECSVSHTSINQVVLTLGYALSGTADLS